RCESRPSFASRQLLELTHARWADVPVVAGHVLEHHPDGFRLQLRNLADGGRDAPRDLVLALLRMTFQDLDIDERHCYLPCLLIYAADKVSNSSHRVGLSRSSAACPERR